MHHFQLDFFFSNCFKVNFYSFNERQFKWTVQTVSSLHLCPMSTLSFLIPLNLIMCMVLATKLYFLSSNKTLSRKHRHWNNNNNGQWTSMRNDVASFDLWQNNTEIQITTFCDIVFSIFGMDRRVMNIHVKWSHFLSQWNGAQINIFQRSDCLIYS